MRNRKEKSLSKVHFRRKSKDKLRNDGDSKDGGNGSTSITHAAKVNNHRALTERVQEDAQFRLL